MVKKKQTNLEDKQLFSLLSSLKKCTDNESDFNRIVGYSFFEALISYDSSNKNLSDEELKFHETKHIYKTLEKNIKECTLKDPWKVSNNLMDLESTLLSYVGNSTKPKSILLEKVMNYNSFKRAEKNFSAYIESKADKIYRNVFDKGAFKGNKNILLNDYDTLLQSFK
ncbi:MAG: hypothetical protein ACLFPJ_02000 [Candidatus Woesearchaeota archaeon]